MRYRLLRGYHVATRTVPHPETGMARLEATEYGEGDVFDSNEDLIAKGLPGAPQKFERVPDDTPLRRSETPRRHA